MTPLQTSWAYKHIGLIYPKIVGTNRLQVLFQPSDLNAMARDRIHVRCLGTAFVALYVLATARIGIADAATKEEVARCRAIEQRAERVDCFKALKRAPEKADGARPSTATGQPLCENPDGLAAMVLAGLLTSDPTKAATPGCQTLPSDAKLELLERHPSVFPFMRIIKVKVTSPTKSDVTVGFTVEMGPLPNEGASLQAPQ
jgi:hypothetical protein